MHKKHHHHLIKLVRVSSVRISFFTKPLLSVNQILSVINEHLNIPRRSMTGKLMLFTETQTVGTRDSERFVNPDINSIAVDRLMICLISYIQKVWLPKIFWESMKKRFSWKDSGIKQKEFFTGNKFALWVDLKSYANDNIHGSGMLLKNTRDGVKLEIKRKVGVSGNINCYMYVVADSLVEIMNQNLKEIIY